MNRIFEHFTDGTDIKCPVCGTSEDRPCFLLPIDGTDEGNICEAAPTHVDCITENLKAFRYNKETGLIYRRGWM